MTAPETKLDYLQWSVIDKLNKIVESKEPLPEVYAALRKCLDHLEARVAQTHPDFVRVLPERGYKIETKPLSEVTVGVPGCFFCGQDHGGLGCPLMEPVA